MSQFILLKLNNRGKIIDVSGLPGLKGKYFHEVFTIENGTSYPVAKYNGMCFKMAKVDWDDGQVCVLIPEHDESCLDYLPVGLAVVHDGNIVYSNEMFRELLGESYYSERFLELVRSLNEKTKEGVLREELGVTSELGEERKLEITASKGYYHGKEAILCTLRDVTRDREFENLFLTLTSKAFVVVYIIQDGKFAFVNEMATALGYSLDELYRMNPFDLAHPEDREQVIDNYVRRLAGEYVEVPYRFRVIAKDGRVLYVDAIAARVILEGDLL